MRAIDLFLILHADHEQNCSTSTVRLTGSSLANVYAVISAGISALWGPRHGGANQEVIRMLERIRDEGGDGTEFVSGPRTRIPRIGSWASATGSTRTSIPAPRSSRRPAISLLKKPGMDDPLFDIALRLEEIALKDDYFMSRNLYPNVDFYSGLILRAAGIPYDMFTVLFAIGRTRAGLPTGGRCTTGKTSASCGRARSMSEAPRATTSSATTASSPFST